MCPVVMAGEGRFLAGTPRRSTGQALQLQRHNVLQGLTCLPGWLYQSHLLVGLSMGHEASKALQEGVLEMTHTALASQERK